MQKKNNGISLAISLLATSAVPAHAQSDWSGPVSSDWASAVSSDWTGAVSSGWFVPGNWIGGVPASGISANINTTTPNPAAIGPRDNAVVQHVVVGPTVAGAISISGAGTLNSVFGVLGNSAGSQGTVSVSGAGPVWTNADSVVVGALGTGNVLIQGGGTLNSNGGSIGLSAGSSGSVTVAGAGSTWNNGPAGGLNVGSFGTGALTITSGGRVLNDTGYTVNVGQYAGGQGTMTVTGAGSLWRNRLEVFVGGAGRGTLTVADGAVVDGPISIARLAGSVGMVNIGAPAGSPATAPGTLTTATLPFGAGSGTLTFNHTSDSYAFAPAVSGNGSVKVLGGTTALTAANTYTGTTTVAAGTLRAGAADAFSAASAHTVAQGATLDTGGFNQRLPSLDNGGTVSLVGAVAGSTLTVNGAYTAHSLLRLGTGLGPGKTGSVSDRLVLDGPAARASGSTTIQITNLRGLGALTTGNGIEVVSGINGASTTAQTTRNAFNLANGHVDAGAYEYRLHPADARGAGENWYLRSTAVAVPPIDPPVEVPIQPPIEPPISPPISPIVPPENPVQPVPPNKPQVPSYRAEVPLLAALPSQLRQADLAMLGNLHRRMGDEAPDQRPDDPTGTAALARRAWARVVYADVDIQLPGIAQARTREKAAGMQAGTDLWATNDLHAGVYVGYLDGDADVTGNARGVVARVGSNEVQSRYLGAYATWMDASGLYFDGVLQGGSQRFTLRPDINPAVSGKASSFMASVEAGKPFAINARWSLEPQAQIAYQHSSLDDMTLSGAEVRQAAADGWIGRLGVRLKGDLTTSAGLLQAYARTNLYTARFGDDVDTFIGPAGTTALTSSGSYSAAEVAAGATLALTTTTRLYGELGHLWSLSGDATVKSSVQGTLGVKVRW